MFTCKYEVKDQLTELAKSQNRTVSNLVETIVIEALTTKESEPKTNDPNHR